MSYPVSAHGETLLHQNGKWYAKRVLHYRDGAGFTEGLRNGNGLRFFETQAEAQTAADRFALGFYAEPHYRPDLER